MLYDTFKGSAVSVRKVSSAEGKCILVVTTCASGKRVRSDAVASAVERGSLHQVGRRWRERLAREERLVAARDLYKGRAFAIARRVAERLGADFGVLSAGLGYVRGEDHVPGYDLTVQTGKTASIGRRIENGYTPAAWWREVRGGRFASDLTKEASRYDLILVAISRSYLELAAEDLIAIEEHVPGRLRLFGRSIDRHTPPALAATAMPYDARFDAIGPAGTLIDFSARALEDFAMNEDVGGDSLSQAMSVSRRLGTVAVTPARAPQRRADDASVRRAIRAFLSDGGQGSAKALAWLRRERGMSCEQGRFAKLFKEEKGDTNQ